ncbi:TPA: hypothetical protein ACQZK0_005217 [Enterobacter mori]
MNHAFSSCNFCNVSAGTFDTVRCIYSYLTEVRGYSTKMYFREHDQGYRELFDTSGKVIAYWKNSTQTWRERTDEGYFEDWDIYGHDSGYEEICGEDDLFNHTLNGM